MQKSSIAEEIFEKIPDFVSKWLGLPNHKFE